MTDYGNDAFVVTGSLNHNSADRFMDRRDLQPVQVILPDDSVVSVVAFCELTETGVSSLAFHPFRAGHVFVSTGADLLCVELRTGRSAVLDFAGLHDIHEMNVIGGILWIANTGRDEVIGIDCHSHSIAERRSLEVYRRATAVTVAAEDRGDGGGGDASLATVDRFHCNQVFESDDGDLLGLVHHVSGRQVLGRAAERLLKRHGNGGLVNLANGEVVRLGLKAPHSVRKVGANYWVLDSGRSALNLYSPAWEGLGVIDLGGWGRGMDISSDGSRAYVGLSAKRRRYWDLADSDIATRNRIVVMETEPPTAKRVVELDRVEQINNVYRITVECAQTLAALSTLRF